MNNMENKKNPFKLLDQLNVNDNTISSEMRVLRLLPYTSINQHFLLVDIINFNLDGKLFFKSDKEIATSIGCAVSSVDKVIKGLKKLNLINTITTDNYQWQTGKGGRRRYIWYNHNHIINLIIANKNFKSEETNDNIINAVEELTNYDFNEAFVNGIINTVAAKQKNRKTPTKPAVEQPKQAPQPQPESEAVKESIEHPKDRFDELFPEDEDDNEHISIKSVKRVINDSEDAEEKEAQKFVEDYEKEMNSISEDEQCLINLISNEDGGVFFDLNVLPVDDIIEHYNDNLNDNLKDSTIFINVVNQLIHKDIITKIEGEDFSTYLILTSEKKELEKVAEMENVGV